MFFAAYGETTTSEKIGGIRFQNLSRAFKAGDRVKVGDLAVTVHGKRVAKAGEYICPGQGYVWLIVDATIENPGSRSAAISSLMMFKLVDVQGYNHNITFGPDLKGRLDGELAPGRKMRGEVAFEVPSSAAGLEFIFEPNVFGQAIFKL